MTITAYSGPIISFGATPTSTAGNGLLGNDLEHNSQRAPDVSDLGTSMLDPRVAYTYNPGAGVTDQLFAFYRGVGNVDYVPTTLSTHAFVPQTTVSTGVTTFTLAAAQSSNGTISTTIIAPETGKASGTLIAIDSTAAYVTYGSDGTVAAWNPGAGTGRCLAITTSSSGDGGTFSIAGRDMYGYLMTETIAVSQGTTNSSGYTIITQKAFKYVSAITNTSTPTSTSVSIGISDRYGMPFKVPYCGQNLDIRLLASAFSSAVPVALSSASFTLASTAATQTSTTPDVRGIYASTTASNGTVRLQITVTPTASGVSTITSTNVTPLFGGAQYSSI